MCPGETGELSRSLAPADLERAIRELGPEPRRCLVCGGARFARLFRRAEKWFWRCEECRLVFVHDIYPEFVADTAHLERTYVFDRLEPAERKKTEKYDEFLHRLAPHRKLGSLLEIGCAQG